MNTDVITTAGLLATGNGECMSWVKLFVDVLKAQHLYTDYSDPSDPSYSGDITAVVAQSSDSNPNDQPDGFIVAPWTFLGNGTGPVAGFPNMVRNPVFPYVDVSAEAGGTLNAAEDNYSWIGSPEVKYVPTGANIGQNSPTPQALFNLHWIVHITIGRVTEYLDPSYGMIYTSPANMADLPGFAGYYREIPVKDTATGHILYWTMEFCPNSQCGNCSLKFDSSTNLSTY